MRSMRTYWFILVLAVAMQARAYEPMSPSFSSAGSAVFYGGQQHTTSLYSSRSVYSQSVSDISASNFEALNSEGGLCEHTSSIRRAGRPTGGGGIGVIENESPIGDVPLFMMLALIIGYIGLKRLKRKMSRKA